MSRILDRPWHAAGVLALTLAAAFGLALGTGVADGEDEASAAREQAYDLAYEQSLEAVRLQSFSRGRTEGESVGRQAGRSAGSREGFDFAGGVTGVRVAEEQVVAAEAARQAAESELADRQGNCGAIRRAPDICPTSEELAAYREAVAANKKPKKKNGRGSGQGSGQGNGGGNG